MSAPSFLNWNTAVNATSTANVAGTFVNNGGPGDTLSDTAGTGVLTVDSHVVVLGDRILLNAQTATWQHGIYRATTANTTPFGLVGTLTLATPGTGYNNGIFRGVTVTSNGGGTGALVDITIVGGVVTSVVLSTVYSDSPGLGGPAAGSGYAVGNTIVPSAAVIGAGSGTLSITVATLAPAWVLTRDQDANTAQQFPGLSVFNLSATNLGKVFIQTVSPVTLDVVSQISGTGAIVQPASTTFQPLIDGTYTNVALTGGHGTLAGATIVVAGSGIEGAIASTSGLVGGTLYTTGTYTAVPLTGGAGTGAVATIVVASGAVTTVTITTAGTGYIVGNVLSASTALIGGTGSGFTVNVATVAGPQISSVTITSVGSGYLNNDVLGFSGYGIGSGGTVVVTTSTPTSSAPIFTLMGTV